MLEALFSRAQDSADCLIEGHWLIQRRRARRIDIPVRIRFGAPLDPDTGEELDRSPRWLIDLGGFPFDGEIILGGIVFSALTDFWPSCRAEPIDEEDYAFRVARQEWAALYDPDDPFGTPGGKIDCMTATLPFLNT